MRSVSYVQRVSLDFTGTIFPHAICLGDADNDSVSSQCLCTCVTDVSYNDSVYHHTGITRCLY